MVMSWYSIIKMNTIIDIPLICTYWWHVIIVNQYSLKLKYCFIYLWEVEYYIETEIEESPNYIQFEVSLITNSDNL